MYRYFISYSHANAYGSGFGTIQVDRTAPINNSDDWRAIAQGIADGESPGTTVILLNIIPLPIGTPAVTAGV